ncbi:hypothetical protein [Corynebacterium efficiens YS-314]|uniref:Uncharacterized protein n=1 Tax=Corynebacterium efficiens (strain DSM 44549 / YS-314 / AJ 12310 / JCM 11189 / NBRC 100395) TaxID=196164 RepID=Q8FMS8_COREF|nr:hypothetical protein [Corynebacterium efficiens YS-314]
MITIITFFHLFFEVLLPPISKITIKSIFETVKSRVSLPAEGWDATRDGRIRWGLTCAQFGIEV